MNIAPALAQTAPPGSGNEPDRVQLERRMTSTATLIEKSSGARQIEASNNAQALATRDKARQIYLQARQAFQAGDYAGAARLLQEAAGRMFEAVRFAAPEQVSAEKDLADFRARLESVKALLAAQKRIGAEKTVTEDGSKAVQSVEKMLGEAERLAAAGDVLRARGVIDQAYLIAKVAISSMRGGDTLVRTLHFATKEDEYLYEIDRNDTHRMLIQVLLAEKRGAYPVQGFLDKASELRARAESASAGRDFASAIQLLEESTRELVRAIRGAGLYIPG